MSDRNPTKQLVIRADATASMGTGHFMRCLALSQGWRDRGWPVTFISCCESDSLRKRLSDEGIPFVALENHHPNHLDWEITSKVIGNYQNAWVVLDGYHFDYNYHNQVKESGRNLLVIDDTAHLDRYYADMVLNPNIYAEKLKYAYAKKTRKLFGIRYVLLRSEFKPWRGWKRITSEIAHKILITMGGSDLVNATLKTVEAIKSLNNPKLEVKIITGASYPYLEKLRNAISSSPCEMSILQSVANMAELMRWADIAVAAGGITCWEMAFMRLPFISIILAENQREISGEAENAGVAVSCGWHYDMDADSLRDRLEILIGNRQVRQKMSDIGEDLIDGFGVERTIKAIVE